MPLPWAYYVLAYFVCGVLSAALFILADLRGAAKPDDKPWEPGLQLFVVLAWPACWLLGFAVLCLWWWQTGAKVEPQSVNIAGIMGPPKEKREATNKS
jgi:hypothetical protein